MSVMTVELVLQAETVAEGAHSIQEVVLNKNLVGNFKILMQYPIFVTGILLLI